MCVKLAKWTLVNVHQHCAMRTSECARLEPSAMVWALTMVACEKRGREHRHAHDETLLRTLAKWNL